MRKTLERAKAANLRGYVVTEDGSVISPFGNKLKVTTGSNGYQVASIRFDGKPMKFNVHQLAAIQKFGKDALDKPGVQVRHRNGDRLDNSRGNILIGTQHDNSMDRGPEALRESALIAARAKRKLSFQEAQMLRDDCASGSSYSELCSEYGISKAAVSYIVNGKTYKIE